MAAMGPAGGAGRGKTDNHVDDNGNDDVNNYIDDDHDEASRAQEVIPGRRSQRRLPSHPCTG